MPTKGRAPAGVTAFTPEQPQQIATATSPIEQTWKMRLRKVPCILKFIQLLSHRPSVGCYFVTCPPAYSAPLTLSLLYGLKGPQEAQLSFKYYRWAWGFDDWKGGRDIVVGTSSVSLWYGCYWCHVQILLSVFSYWIKFHRFAQNEPRLSRTAFPAWICFPGLWLCALYPTKIQLSRRAGLNHVRFINTPGPLLLTSNNWGVILYFKI